MRVKEVIISFEADEPYTDDELKQLQDFDATTDTLPESVREKAYTEFGNNFRWSNYAILFDHSGKGYLYCSAPLDSGSLTSSPR